MTCGRNQERLPCVDQSEQPSRSGWARDDPMQDHEVAKLTLIGLMTGFVLVAAWLLLKVAIA